jgi:hypothetical protein
MSTTLAEMMVAFEQLHLGVALIITAFIAIGMGLCAFHAMRYIIANIVMSEEDQQREIEEWDDYEDYRDRD